MSSSYLAVLWLKFGAWIASGDITSTPTYPANRRGLPNGRDERFGFGVQPQVLAPGMERFWRHSHDCLPLSRVEIVCLLLPQGQVYLRYIRNATIFRHFLTHFPRILANELRELMREEWWRTEKYSSRCHAILCEKADVLKAPCSVASYLENGNF